MLKPSSPKASIQDASNPFVIHVSAAFLVKILLFVAVLSFGVGRLSDVIHLNAHSSATPTGRTGPSDSALPPLVYSAKKEVPHTKYSAKYYDVGGVASMDAFAEFEEKEKFAGIEVQADGTMSKNESNDDHVVGEQKMDEVHEPTGEHLLVDIKSVDGVFLNSEVRLAEAMVELINMSGLTMLSYHCHGLPPVGVSCVGVLLESHISFHTWPVQGVITLDLFTCGPSRLLPLLPDIKRLFGVPSDPTAATDELVEEPYMQWAHKRRGFRDLNAAVKNPDDVDMHQFLLGWLEYDKKDLIVSEETDFQTIDIFEVINPRFHSLETYERSLQDDDDSYYKQQPDLFRPDKVVYLDGIMQSRLMGEAAYHEALVHPAMVSHVNPKRVAIIGGGEGATLREVLKHNTVETVTMIEIDEEMVDICREYLPEWSDCSNLVGSNPSCFDDPRTEVFYTDAISWFIDRFGNEDTIDESQLYDVIIMDALDPSSYSAFSDMLYLNGRFTEALSNALDDEGIFVAQVGEEDGILDAGYHLTDKRAEQIFTSSLIENEFESVETYEEAHGGFMATWKFLIAFMDTYDNAWNSNEAEIDLELQRRAMKTSDDSVSPFRYFDGATMMAYQYPSRVRQEIFCRYDPLPEFCDQGHGFDPERPNIPVDSFEVKKSAIPHAGRGLHTKVDIAKGTYLAIDESVHDMVVLPTTTKLIRNMHKVDGLGLGEKWGTLDAYLFAYGFESEDENGGPAYSVDPGVFTFVNHGCNGTHVMGFATAPVTATEMEVDAGHMPNLFPTLENAGSNVFKRRNAMEFMNAVDVALRDIKAGEEILDNYLTYYSAENWEKGIQLLRYQCSQNGAGPVADYETKHKHA